MRSTWATLAARPPPGMLPRSGGTALPLPTADGFILVGGYTEAVSSSPTSPPVRAPTAEAWTVRLGAPQPARFGGAAGTTATAAAAAPPPRLAAAGATVGSTAWLVGGWDPGDRGDGGAILDDVWSVDTASGAWTPHPAAALPAPASRHAAAALPDGRIIVITHRCGESVLCLDVADPDAPVLGALACAPDPAGAGYPPSRGLASLVALPVSPSSSSTATTHTLLLFGGAPRRGGMDNDLWSLTLGPRGGGSSAGQWARLGPAGAAPWPAPRCSHVAAGLPGGMVVWGGSYYTEGGGLVARDDGPWWWDASTGAWSALTPDGDAPPAPRNAAAAAPVVDGGTGRHGVLIQGGWDPFRVTYGDTAVLWVG